MEILLLNSNPVVSKLVTLSAQKTSNSLDVSQSIEAVEPKNYDLLIIDDALYDEDGMAELDSKIKYSKSLYICSKDAKYGQEFTKILKKPFLPTDLVEILITLAKDKDMDGVNLESIKNSTNFDDMDLGLSGFDDMEELEELDDLEEVKDLDKKSHSMNFEDLDEDELGTHGLDEEIDFDSEDIDFDEEDVVDLESTQSKIESILDKDELKEVQSLLEENEMEEFDSEDFNENIADLNSKEDLLVHGNEIENSAFDDLDLEDSDLGTDELDLDLKLEDEDLELKSDSLEFDIDEAFEDEEKLAFEDLQEQTFIDESIDEKSEDESAKEEELDELQDSDDDLLEMSDEISQESDTQEHEDLLIDEDEFANDGEDTDDTDANEDEDECENECEDELQDLESQIESAVKELSDEDLQREVDEDMLMDIDSLTSRDLKLAIGEEVLENDELDDAEEKESFAQDEKREVLTKIHEDTNDGSTDGVEALKKLLTALSNEDVAASLKGMKININITLGE